MRALVCGGRRFNQGNWLAEVLSSFENSRGEKITFLIHGGASGADSLAGMWARENNVPFQVFHAKWKEHGRNAGPIRNRQMLDEGKPDVVIAFPGGSGTANMIRQARDAGVEVIIIEEEKRSFPANVP